MAKLKLLQKEIFGSFNNWWLKDIVNQYFDLEMWDSNKTYPQGTLFYLDCTRVAQNPKQIDELKNLGFQIVIDNLWERDREPIPDTYKMYCVDWFWYNESLWYSKLDYQNYVPQKNNLRYLGFMPMWRKKIERTDFVKRINCDRLLWSYIEEGKFLPNDSNIATPTTQRYFNSEWYDSCYMSMVVETMEAYQPEIDCKFTPTFITEKTFKPVAFQHPFLVYGDQGTLKLLHEWGFVTYNNLWDESYDSIADQNSRRDAIINLLNSIEIKPHDSETLARLEHNKQRFFDQQLVNARVIQKVIEPIINYAETR